MYVLLCVLEKRKEKERDKIRIKYKINNKIKDPIKIIFDNAKKLHLLPNGLI